MSVTVLVTHARFSFPGGRPWVELPRFLVSSFQLSFGILAFPLITVRPVGPACGPNQGAATSLIADKKHADTPTVNHGSGTCRWCALRRHTAPFRTGVMLMMRSPSSRIRAIAVCDSCGVPKIKPD